MCSVCVGPFLGTFPLYTTGSEEASDAATVYLTVRPSFLNHYALIIKRKRQTGFTE